MSQIAEEMKPSPFVISILTKLISVIPKWKIIPSQDIIEISYKEPEFRKQVCFFLYNIVIKIISIQKLSKKLINMLDLIFSTLWYGLRFEKILYVTEDDHV